MNLSEPFVRRPIGTVLMTLGVAIAGIAAYVFLPVAPLPQVDFPVVSVQATLPGASPDTMASSVATPLERRLGHIADVNEMTSQSSLNQTRITLQFNLDRDINGAARDVQAAINAARIDLPATLRSNPTYRKVNPADQPILILALTSKTKTPGQIYDSAANILQQQLSQIKGVGEVDIGGGSLPAVRVDVQPYALAKYGIGLEDVRAALASANANRPKGLVQDGERRLQIYTNDQGVRASDYRPLVIAYRNGSAVRLTDVAAVTDGQEDIHNLGLFNGEPAIVVRITREPGANIVSTVDAIKKTLPLLQAELPADIAMAVAVDRTTTIRASLNDVERTLAIAILLVVAVVAVFLRNGRATLVPAVAVTVSLLGTLGVMFLLGFSLDNLSLMALTVSTGFVVDDAIVVLENITRHLESGMDRFEAALLGAKEVGFTVLSISISLIAVFTPILLMGGIIGRLFREFALTLSTAILVSLAISLTTTPMLCAYFIGRPSTGDRQPWWSRAAERSFDAMTRVYERALRWSLDSGPVILAILAATIVLNIYLFIVVPKGFFPQQDTGLLAGGMQMDQSTSFQVSRSRMKQFADLVGKDPSVQSVVGFTGGGGSSGGFMFAALKPESERPNADQVIARLRMRSAGVTGASLFLQAVQDFRFGGRQSNAEYQYTLEADSLSDLRTWATKLTDQLKKDPTLTDVNSDQQDHGLQAFVTVDRDTASRLGLTSSNIDNILYDSFGQRQVSTIYNALNQYHVIMEVPQAYAQDPTALSNVYLSTETAAQTSTGSGGGSASAAVSSASTASSTTSVNTLALVATATTAAGAPGAAPVSALSGPVAPPSRNAATGVAVSGSAERIVPLTAIAQFSQTSVPTSVNHQDVSPATTLSFNLAPGKSLSDANASLAQAAAAIGMPASVHGSFQGTAKIFQQSLSGEPVLILAALIAVYIVLGVLYESYIHPLTVLSTLPSAGVGAVTALLLFQTEFSIIALIGVILLIGIVKKNAILIIDFALDAERAHGLSTRDAIYQACLLRFRPIMMTTFAAMLGALPLAVAWGEGSELRRPLGITIIGGLLVSQVLTLLTTPVVYLYLDRWRRRTGDESRLSHLQHGPTPPAPEPAA
ncbi:MAG: efflux RND transporter permease subunit [Caulobacteraceae bacterium]|nr:efflux RND transporter permease subunit [Caulobacteraceae bacterium]